MHFRKPSPAMVVALVALLFTMTGISVAASVSESGDARSGPGDTASTAGAKRGPRGPRGLRGYRGLEGPAGTPGAAGTPGVLGVTTIIGAEISLPPGGYGASPTATCPTGSTVVGTGFNGPFNVVGGFVEKFGNFVGGFFGNESSITVTGKVQAICAQLPPGATSASVRSSSADRDRYRRAVDQAAASWSAAHPRD